jgi:DNA-binding transcriptional ArsR family regulator
MPVSAYDGPVARASTTSDVFNAIGDAHRREILDALITGEKTVGTIVNDLPMSQPQVSKHLRVLSEAGLVRCRAAGRHRLYRLAPEHLRPLRDWVARYGQAMNDRLDRMEDYLQELQREGEPQRHLTGTGRPSPGFRVIWRLSPPGSSALRSSSSSTY